MTNDELRALADALDSYPPSGMTRAADYLRAQADAQPTPAAPQAEPCIGNDSACPCQDGDACHYKDAADGTKAWPAPQAEPKREPNPDEVICPACTHQFRAIPENVQKQLWAKREPLTYEQLVSACYTYRHDFGLLDPDEQELVIEEAGRWAKAFGIGGSDEHQ